MAFDLTQIKQGGVPKPTRVLLLGVEGIGKSTFGAACLPDGTPTELTRDTLFIPATKEQGIDGIPVAQTDPVNSFDELMEVLVALYQAEEIPCTRIVLDSATSLEPLVIEEAIARDPKAKSIETLNGGYGNQELAINQVWGDLLEALDALRERGVSSVLTGHVRVRKARDPLVVDDYDTYEQDIRVSGANYLQRWADAVLFATYKTDVASGKTVSKRVLYTQKSKGHPGKVRHVFGDPPYELPFDWSAWTEAVAQP